VLAAFPASGAATTVASVVDPVTALSFTLLITLAPLLSEASSLKRGTDQAPLAALGITAAGVFGVDGALPLGVTTVEVLDSAAIEAGGIVEIATDVTIPSSVFGCSVDVGLTCTISRSSAVVVAVVVVMTAVVVIVVVSVVVVLDFCSAFSCAAAMLSATKFTLPSSGSVLTSKKVK
jgi:hypothetical protein